MDKPIMVARQEFIEKLVNLLNTSNLPVFVLHPIIKDVYLELEHAMLDRYQNERRAYEEDKDKNESEAECD